MKPTVRTGAGVLSTQDNPVYPATTNERGTVVSSAPGTGGSYSRTYLVADATAGVLAVVVGLTQPTSAAIGAPFALAGPAAAAFGIAYWTILGLIGSSMVVKVRNGAVWGSWFPFVVAAAVLGGPPAGVALGLIGTLEVRELRYVRPTQVAVNHFEATIAAVAAAFAAAAISGIATSPSTPTGLVTLIATITAAFAYMVPSTGLAYMGIARRQRRRLLDVAREQIGIVIMFTLVAAAMAWVMVEMYTRVAWWSPIVILGPVLASWLALDRDGARWQADHDQLTRLANRALFERSLTAAEHRARRQGHPSLLVLVDLDGFKKINDEFGHAAGDAVLREVGARLAATTRRGDVAARIGGDEFALLIAGVADGTIAEKVAARVRSDLMGPISSGPADLSIGASIGTAVLTRDNHDGTVMMGLADRALYEDKHRHSTRPIDKARGSAQPSEAG